MRVRQVTMNIERLSQVTPLARRRKHPPTSQGPFVSLTQRARYVGGISTGPRSTFAC